jgi:pimeloyl-ACP methyl ester carboxylesterase
VALGITYLPLNVGVRCWRRPWIAALIAYSQPSKSDPLALAAVLRRPANPVITPARLGGLMAEMLLINGDADSIALPDTGLRMVLPRVHAVRMPGVGHLDLTYAPAFQTRAMEFLNQDKAQRAYMNCAKQ